MRWFKRSSNDSPRLISLSPLRHSDQNDHSVSSYYINQTMSDNGSDPPALATTLFSITPQITQISHNDLSQSVSSAVTASSEAPTIRKSRIDTPTIALGKKRSHRSPNCYNVQEGKIIDRPPSTKPNRFQSPIRIKNKNICFPSPSLSPAAQKPNSDNSSSIQSDARCVLDSSPSDKTIVDKSCRANKSSHSDTINDNTFETSLQSLKQCIKPLTPAHKSAVWDFNKGANSNFECAKIATISYREKRNPLSSTRLSCYKPKISDNYSLPSHYKSVDDFLYLNQADEIASNSSSSCSEYSSDIQRRNGFIDNVNTSNGGLVANDIETVSGITRDKKNTFRSLNSYNVNDFESECILDTEPVQNGTTEKQSKIDGTHDHVQNKNKKSIENIIQPKLYALATTTIKCKKDLNMANFSEKIKCMSTRTQKLFSKFYSNSNNSSGSKQQVKQSQQVKSNTSIPNGEGRQTGADETDSKKKVLNSRRSLSYGNLPGLDDIRQPFHLHKTNSKVESNEITEECNEITIDEFSTGPNRNLRKISIKSTDLPSKDDLLVGGEDTDSGILINESGQSSIVDSEYPFHYDNRVMNVSESNVKSHKKIAYGSNQEFEFKFVHLCIEEGDRERCLGLSVQSIRSDSMNKFVGYRVASILPGGIVDKEGTIQIGDEIVNVMGRCLRGLTILQVQQLLADSTHGTKGCEIDLVICRYVANSKEKLRKKTIDPYLNTLNDDGADVCDRGYTEYASNALKIDGNKYNTLGTRRSKAYLSVMRPICYQLNASEAQFTPNTTRTTTATPTSPVKKRATQFQKNHSSYSSMSNKLFRRSLIDKQQQQHEQLQTQCNLKLTSTHFDQENSHSNQQHVYPDTREDISRIFDSSMTVPPMLNVKKLLAKSSFNLCDDEKLSLSLAASNHGAVNNSMIHNLQTPSAMRNQLNLSEIGAGNYCTLPRRAKSALCSFHTVVYEKGPGKKKLGFTVVGGTDTGAIGIFIKSILPTGQAADDGRLKAGDEILAVNGQVCHDLSHEEAVKLFKSVKCGEISLHVCRRIKIKIETNVAAQ